MNMTDAQLFSHLLAMLGTAAMQAMGKIVHPLTGKSEVDIEQARFSIDMLEMLDRKTRGNREDRENAALANLLTNLRLNFVETAAEKKPAADPTTDAPAPAAEENPAAEKKDAAPDGAARFHKSYG